MYRIAEVPFTISCPSDFKIVSEIPYRFFESDVSGGVFIRYEKKAPPALKKENVVYYDTSTIVVREENRIFRYMGNFDTGNIDAWKNCVSFLKEDRTDFQIFLKTKSSLLSERQIFEAIGLEYVMAYYQRAILHASFINYKNRGILFTAPSGTGKSTQADLWKKYHSEVEIVNGDRSILSCEKGRVYAYGLPFCGSSGISLNRKIPLYAIVVLRQGERNEIQRLDPAKAFRFLLSECATDIWDKKGTENILDLLSKIVKKVPVYYFACLPEKSAVDILAYTLCTREWR